MSTPTSGRACPHALPSVSESLASQPREGELQAQLEVLQLVPF